jgi:hypothetical protein
MIHTSVSNRASPEHVAKPSIIRTGQDTTEGIRDATELLLDEIREGFERLRKLI